ncbi:MAG: AMP-binding protein [Clostridia bacterium]|nr:AMP-binding protein [Clostridia bacterium]
MSTLDTVVSVSKFSLIKEYIGECIKRFADNRAFTLKDEYNGETNYRHITYHAFGKQVREFGSGLLKLGLAGKRVAIIAANCYEWILSYTAVLCGVGVAVPLDKELTENEILLSLKRSKADAIVFDEKHAELMYRLAEDNDMGINTFISTKKLREDVLSVNDVTEMGTLFLKTDTSFDSYYPNPDDVATIIFTSGTTSSSKAVMLSNRNIAANLYDLMSTERVFTDDRNLVFLPLHHTFGSTGLLFFLCSGACNMFCDGLRHVQKNLKEYKITTFVCVPLLLEAMYRNIMKNIEKRGKLKTIKLALKASNGLRKLRIDARRKFFKPIIDELGGAIRFIISGASAISREVAKGFNDMGILTVQGYGLTETAPVLAAENEHNMRLGSVGKAMPSVEISIETPNEDGIGEIAAKGPNIMLGYYEMPEETEAVLKDGKFYTGDLGRIDKDGFLYITGRKKNVIVLKSGKNVYPEELEEIVSKLPYVSEVMVYAKKREDNSVIAVKIVYAKDYFKQKHPDADESAIYAIVKEDITKINDTLPAYKHIKAITVQTTPMIKTTTAKIKRHEEIKSENDN